MGTGPPRTLALGTNIRGLLVPPHAACLPETFLANRPNANLMLAQITQTPCPAGIIPTATTIWKQIRTRQFYGPSHLTLMARINISQEQVGLGITKAYALQIRQAARKMGIRPADHSTNPNPSIPVAAS